MYVIAIKEKQVIDLKESKKSMWEVLRDEIKLQCYDLKNF